MLFLLLHEYYNIFVHFGINISYHYTTDSNTEITGTVPTEFAAVLPFIPECYMGTYELLFVFIMIFVLGVCCYRIIVIVLLV